MMMRTPLRAELTCSGYSAGHPWYYLLGGQTPSLRQIRAYVVERGTRGYLHDDIELAHARPEPKRSQELANLREEVVRQLCSDISRYRQIARALRDYRKQQVLDKQPDVCDDVHVSMSLKFNHLVNGLAHLNRLDKLPKQLSLF
jgi:hypothetical protein